MARDALRLPHRRGADPVRAAHARSLEDRLLRDLSRGVAGARARAPPADDRSRASRAVTGRRAALGCASGSGGTPPRRSSSRSRWLRSFTATRAATCAISCPPSVHRELESAPERAAGAPLIAADQRIVVAVAGRNARVLLAHPSRLFDAESCFPVGPCARARRARDHARHPGHAGGARAGRSDRELQLRAARAHGHRRLRDVRADARSDGHARRRNRRRAALRIPSGEGRGSRARVRLRHGLDGARAAVRAALVRARALARRARPRALRFAAGELEPLPAAVRRGRLGSVARVARVALRRAPAAPRAVRGGGRQRARGRGARLRALSRAARRGTDPGPQLPGVHAVGLARSRRASLPGQRARWASWALRCCCATRSDRAATRAGRCSPAACSRSCSRRAATRATACSPTTRAGRCRRCSPIPTPGCPPCSRASRSCATRMRSSSARTSPPACWRASGPRRCCGGHRHVSPGSPPAA